MIDQIKVKDILRTERKVVWNGLTAFQEIKFELDLYQSEN